MIDYRFLFCYGYYRLTLIAYYTIDCCPGYEIH